MKCLSTVGDSFFFFFYLYRKETRTTNLFTMTCISHYVQMINKPHIKCHNLMFRVSYGPFPNFMHDGDEFFCLPGYCFYWPSHFLKHLTELKVLKMHQLNSVFGSNSKYYKIKTKFINTFLWWILSEYRDEFI